VATVSRTRTLPAPVQAAWSIVADFGSISTWADNVDHSCILGHGPGGALGTSRRVQVGRNTLVEKITEYVPPTVLAYDITGLPRRLGRVTNHWELAATALGGTRVTLTSTVEMGADPFARIAAHLVCRMMARQSQTMLAGLAKRVESPP